MIIYTPQPCSRFRYACEMIFHDLETTWKITSSKEELISYPGARIAYAENLEDESGVFFIKRTANVWGEGIHEQDAAPTTKNGMAVLFANDSSIGFDIFGAVFYMLSRYEEYLPFKGDSMKRFSAKDAVLAEDHLYRRPWVDTWIKDLHTQMKERWPELHFVKRNYKMISTMDIDSAYAYRNKGAYRTLGGMAKDLVRFDFDNLQKRLWALTGGEDHYDTYDYIREQLTKQGQEHIFFFLLADFGEFDKNVPHTSDALRSLISSLSETYEIGIHPGIGSHQKVEVLKEEKRRLEEIMGRQCTMSRQHYLLIRFPETYRRLIDSGISDDYSMGFADDVGFRAGTSRSFPWFDLEKNETTSLTVHPCAVMETTLNKYLQLDTHDAIRLAMQVKSDVKKVEGTFILLWHNETLSEEGEWKGWRKVWEFLLEE